MNKNLLFLSVLVFFFFAQTSAFADSMGNSQFILNLNPINTTKQNVQPVTSSQPPAYTLQSGFAESSPLSPLTFSIDSNLIDFGIISATSPVIRTSTLTVSNAQMGYQVLSSENHQLKTKSGEFIPDTTCDDGTPCTETIPGIWTSVTTFGFGYHCDNINNSICENTSSGENLYKHFANPSVGQQPQQIVQNINNANKEDEATITYKVNVSGSQQVGVYSNVVTYLAVPNF